MPEPATYLFRAEAVNLASTVYDTADISSIRGGGFYLLDRIRTLAETYPDHLITEGASTAVFKFPAENPAVIRSQLLKDLYEGTDCIPDMMFMVEYVEHKKTDDFAKDMARLMGKIRVAQMRSPNIRIFDDTLEPGIGEDGKLLAFDELNRVLPAREKKDERGLSSFTINRRDQGKVLRQKIYEHILKDESDILDKMTFTNDLETLSKSKNQGNLNGKIAYIYVDGNKFGKLQKHFSEDELAKYDKIIKDFKRDFLGALLETANHSENFKTDKNETRLETLLWGGDELKLIVPAWLGWKVAKTFFECAKNLEMPLTRNGQPANKHLTFAMGLVFAHHKNPIQNIGKIAEMLADSVKNEIAAFPGDAVYDRNLGNRIHYVVLESYETLPSTYDRFAGDYYHSDPGDLLLSPKDMKGLQEFALVLSKGFPKSKLFEIIRAWIADRENASGTAYADVLTHCLKLLDVPQPTKQMIIAKIMAVTGTKINDKDEAEGNAQKGYRWIQISELWDYLTGEDSE